jgi:hypothetical protein
MGKFLTEFFKIIIKIFLTIIWGATLLAELLLKQANAILQSIITKH